MTRCICWGTDDGQFRSADQPVTKTTNAIIVLSRNHPLVLKKQSRFSIDVARAASICCQDRTLHGSVSPVQSDIRSGPYLFMRAAATGISGIWNRFGHHVLLLPVDL